MIKNYKVFKNECVYDKGDVVWVNLNSVYQDMRTGKYTVAKNIQKTRPCIVYSKRKYNHSSVLIIPIKTDHGNRCVGGVYMPIELERGRDSLVCLSDMTAVPTDRIITGSKLGTLSDSVMKEIDRLHRQHTDTDYDVVSDDIGVSDLSVEEPDNITDQESDIDDFKDWFNRSYVTADSKKYFVSFEKLVETFTTETNNVITIDDAISVVSDIGLNIGKRRTTGENTITVCYGVLKKKSNTANVVKLCRLTDKRFQLTAASYTRLVKEDKKIVEDDILSMDRYFFKRKYHISIAQYEKLFSVIDSSTETVLSN